MKQELLDRYTRFILNERRISRKLERELQKICKAECIKLEYYDDIDEMNELNGKVLRSTYASGLYQYSLFTMTGELVLGKSTIQVHNADDDRGRAMVLAHELGHHFCIKNHNDSSEEGADRYIRKLCKDILEPYEYQFIDSTLALYSDGLRAKDLDIPKISNERSNLRKEIKQLAKKKKYVTNNTSRIQ